MTIHRHRIALAGLLHDIGKVGQRANAPFRKEIASKYEGANIAPVSNGNPSRLHVWWTAWWIEQHQKAWKELGLYGSGEDSLSRLAARHHRNDLDLLERIIQLADRISSGMERPQEEAKEEKEIQEVGKYYSVNLPQYSYQAIPLLSLWSILCSPYGNPRQREYWYYPLKPLNITDALFPQHSTRFASLEKEYKKLWKGFRKEAEHLLESVQKGTANDSERFTALINSLLSLIHKYFWSVPSATYGTPHPITSLYDHLKTTSALATCLFDWMEEDRNAREEMIRQGLGKERPFLLVGGDLSGIQSFIYDIYSSKAKKALKGRSFYLQLLVEVVIEHILRELDYWRTHVLYSSGGKFFLVLPNTDEVKEKLKAIRTAIHRWLWEEHQGTLALNMDWVEFGMEGANVVLTPDEAKQVNAWKENTTHPYADLYSQENQGNFNEEWKKSIQLSDLWWLLNDKLGRQKHRKWWHLFKDPDFKNGQGAFSFKKLFECAEEGGAHGGKEKEVCAVTGRYVPKGEVKNIGTNQEPVYVLKNIEKQVKLGGSLHNSDFLIFVPPSVEGPSHLSYIELLQGWRVYWAAEQGGNIVITSSGWRVWCLNHPENFLAPAPFEVHAPASWGFFFYGGYRTPIARELHYTRTATFEEMAQVLENEWITPSTPIDCNERFPCPSDGTPDFSTDWEVPALPEDSGGRDEASSTTYIGVFRADVDRLGELFIYGLAPKFQSFATLSTLSWQMSWFFSGYINTLQARDRLFRKHVQIVYAGGDDVFAVGRWDALLAFAMCLRKEFWRFVATRPDITLSAGLPFFRPKYPIQAAAEVAGEAEAKSKKFQHGKNGSAPNILTKDALTLMDATVGWSPKYKTSPIHALDELDHTIKTHALPALQLLKNDQLPTGFLHLINDYYGQLEALEEAHRGTGPHPFEEPEGSSYRLLDFSHPAAVRWLWHFAYQINRRMPREDQENKKDLLSFLQRLLHFSWSGDSARGIPNSRTLILLALASQLAILYHRELLKNE